MLTSTDFYRTLYQGATTGLVSIFVQEGNGAPNIVFADVQSIDREVARVVEAHPSATIFYSMGLLGERPASGRGTSADVISAHGFYIDLDMPRAEGSRYGERSEGTISVDGIVDTFSDIGLKPAAVTNTGNGSHAYILLDEPALIEGEEDRQRVKHAFQGASDYVRDQLAARGWKTDNTADLARLDRAVGSFNVKDPANPKLVTVDFLDPDQRYSLEYLASLAPAEVLTTSGKSSADDRPASSEKSLGNFDAVLMGCPFMAHCVANPAVLSEPEWWAMICTLAYCENGRELAHKYSAGYPGYSRAETDRKFDHATRDASPPTYAHIRTILSSYQPDESFGLYGMASSPISFATYPPELVRLMVTNAYDLTTDRFIDLRTMRAKTEKAFKAEHVHRDGLKSPQEAFWRAKNSLKVQKRDYVPGGPRIVGDPENLVMNTYQPPALVPVEGEFGDILRHFELLIPDEAVRENVLDRFAFAVQHPETKMESAIVLYGPPGGGKSTIVRWLGEIIGPWNVRSVPTSVIESKYGAAKGNIYLVVFDEIRGVTEDGVNNLKALETEPTVWVEEKHMPLHEIRTPYMIIMMSNYANALPLSKEDRRHLVINTPAAIPPKSYFNNLYAKAPSQLAGFAHFLKQRSLVSFDPHETPQETRGKDAMVKAAMPSLQRAITDAMEGQVGVFEKDIGTVDDVIKAIVQDGWPSVVRPNPKLVGTALSELSVEQLPRQTFSNGLKPRLRVWRNQDQWQQASRLEIEEHVFGSSAEPKAPSAIPSGRQLQA